MELSDNTYKRRFHGHKDVVCLKKLLDMGGSYDLVNLDKWEGSLVEVAPILSYKELSERKQLKSQKKKIKYLGRYSVTHLFRGFIPSCLIWEYRDPMESH